MVTSSPIASKLLMKHNVCNVYVLPKRVLGLKLTSFLFMKQGTSKIGLYRRSRPVRKSGKISKSGLSGNRTFYFPDDGLLTLLKIEKRLKKKIKNQKKKFKIFFVFFLFITVLKVRHPGRKTSGFRTVRILKILRTSGSDVMSGRALQ